MNERDRTPRPLTSRERAILDKLLALDFPEAETARAQVGGEVLGRDGCTCGCGSFDLIVPGTREGGGFRFVADLTRYPRPGVPADDADDPYISASLWMVGDRVGGVEFISYTDERPGIPDPDELLSEEPPDRRTTRGTAAGSAVVAQARPAAGSTSSAAADGWGALDALRLLEPSRCAPLTRRPDAPAVEPPREPTPRRSSKRSAPSPVE